MKGQLMKHFKQSAIQYVKRIAARGIGIALAAATAYTVYLSAAASQMGTIPDLAAHVYENMDTNSGIVANVIMGYNFPILAEETDSEGNVWYLIEADTGARGYIPAGSVIRVTSGSQTTNTQRENTQTDNAQTGNAQTNVSENDNEDENNLPENVRSQIFATEVVNIRENPSTTDEIIGKIPRGTTLDYISIVTNEDGEDWFEVSYEDIHGYVKLSTVSLIETPIEDGEIPSAMTSIDIANIDIDQMIETARLYQDENPPKETSSNTETLNETQSQEQIDYEDSVLIDESAQDTVKKGFELHVDVVVIVSALGILICAAIIGKTFGRVVKMYH
ncbi:MAG: SH3 domain-containing protein [Clostridiales bacterium]|nr:SH3 domain-containing protein [Clostridiales bacterium]